MGPNDTVIAWAHVASEKDHLWLVVALAGIGRGIEVVVVNGSGDGRGGGEGGWKEEE